MLEKKFIFLDNYYIAITIDTSNDKRLYILYDNNDNKKCESFNRDSFLLKCKEYVKINNNTELLIASY